MATLEELQARRELLVRQRESLQTSVRWGDKAISYDLTAAKEAIADLDRQIAARKGRRAGRQVRFTTSKDL